MQTPREISENRAMHGIAVALLSEDRERLALLQERLRATRLGHEVFSNVGFPVSPTDTIIRQVQESRAEIVIVEIPTHDAHRAIRAIELIRSTTQQIAIFANGEMTQPANIVATMRNGASEYVDRSAGYEVLLEALNRFNSLRTRATGGSGKARVFTFLSAKGGTGCTTAAVNTALALQKSHGDVVLLDFAPIGHAALHLNLRPQFGVLDALQNLHRLDVSLLDGLMTTTKEGLHLLAGPQQPYPTEPTPGELARLFDLLVSHYRFVIVDVSSRLDPTTHLLSDLSNAVLIVAQTDVVSLCCAARIHSFLEEGTGRDRVRLVLNRYKKIPGFGDDDVQQTTNCKMLWKVPNAFHVVSHCIDHGTPVVLQEAPEVSRSYKGLAAALAEASNSDGPDLAYGGEGAPKKTPPGRLKLSPIRSGD
ncbi:MAG TPA: cellulose synthase operon protein YhjQ/BcsQ [Candidatus Sulfotelmatobacter sp.]